MFILYAIPIGVVAGFLVGGRLDGLGATRLHWVPLILLGLLLQVAIFSDAVGRAVGDAGPAIYIASAVFRPLARPPVRQPEQWFRPAFLNFIHIDSPDQAGCLQRPRDMRPAARLRSCRRISP